MKHYNKASLFLMEMIIAIMFFALTSAICIQVFAKAQSMNDETLKKAHAAMAASNIAETYRSQKLNDYYQVDKFGCIYFDNQWNIISSVSPYKALLVENENILSITIFYKDKEIYNIDCMSYQQKVVKKDVRL